MPDPMPANSLADRFKALTEDVLADLKLVGNSLVAQATEEDLPVVKRTLAKIALYQAMVMSDPVNGERHAKNLAYAVGTLQNIATKYQLQAAREARDFVIRLSLKLIDFGFSFIGLPGAGTALTGGAGGSDDA